MAQQRNNKSKSKGTSFGKKSNAEKAFRGKKKSRPDDSFSGERRSSSSSAAFSKPFRKPGESPDGDRSGGFSKPRWGKGPGDFKRPFQKPYLPAGKREGGSFGAQSEDPKKFSKSFRAEEGVEKPFRKTGSASSSFGRPGGFSKPESDFKRPYKKREEGSSDSRSERPRFSKPFRSKGGDEKPFRRYGSSSPSFGKQGFGKAEGDFKRPLKRRDEGSSDSDKPRFSKPFRSEGGDEKPFRKTTNSAGSFGRPGKFEKPEGGKRYSDDFKKPFKKEEDSSREEKPKRFERKPYVEGEQRPFVQKRVIRSAKSFKPKVWEEKPSDGLTRLNKYIANSGVCSRREADNLITMGLISVNKVTITELGYKVKQGDQVRYEDKLLKAEKPVYILLNKPKGFITTTDDPQERNTVMNLVANACKERIYPVGRLDRNTTGLLLLTNDGDLAEKLMHPSYKAKKIYKVELDQPLTKNDFIKIQEGVHLPEGKAMVGDLQMISEDSKTVGIEIHIGWNRVVRRIFESLGYGVVRLDRSVYAGLDKKEIGRGEWRFLKPEEIVKLKHFKG
ncbi:MAG: pseudouridine synthase [Bacteroidota bacterium]